MKRKGMIVFLTVILLLATFTACSGSGGTSYTAAPMMIHSPVATSEFGIAVFRGNETLRDQIWAALQVLSANGTVSQIARRWFGEDTNIIPPDPYATRALEEVRERTLIIGFDATNAPMSFFDQRGILVGFDIDLAQVVCDYFGWELELLPIEWADREVELASANIDALWGGVNLTEGLRDRLYYIGPYMESGQVVVTMSDRRIQNLRGTRRRDLAFRPGTAGELALIENTGFANGLREAIPVETISDALRALQDGEVDAVIMDRWAADYFIRQGDVAAFGDRLSE